MRSHRTPVRPPHAHESTHLPSVLHEIGGGRDGLREVGDEHRGEETDADRKPGRDLDPEDRGLRNAIHHGADHDPHRPSAAETSIDDGVSDEQDRSADQHPDRELEAVECLCFRHEVEGDRFDKCTRSEASQYPDELRWEVDPVHEEPAQQQSGLRQRPQRDRLQHQRFLLSDVVPRVSHSPTA